MMEFYRIYYTRVTRILWNQITGGCVVPSRTEVWSLQNSMCDFCENISDSVFLKVASAPSVRDRFVLPMRTLCFLPRDAHVNTST